ncbi:hypothetical protein HZR84_12155 [Hyphobacterium sp. CCMP332]|nr:hypothetical protein HZR84_12155 [Hyphobacterium sp. CCMP332]
MLKTSGLQILFVLFSFSVLAKNDSIPLPAPGGEFPIGTMSFFWTDGNREMSYSSHKGDNRTITVQLWYPAEKDSLAQKALYAGNNSQYEMVNTHSKLYAPFNKSITSAPLILIIPGRGMERFAYTGLIEELASHGFVVASIDMPELGYMLLPDGKEIKTSERFAPPEGLMAGPYEKVDEFYENAVKLGMADIEFVLNKIEKLNANDPAGRFTSKINLQSIGVFGHSLGGRIAGQLAASNKKVKAYTAMEGIPPRDVRFEGKISIPSLMLCSSGTWYYAEKNYRDFIDNRKATVHMIELVDFGHNSLTDGPILFPRAYKYAVDPFRALEISRKLLVDFFNQELNQKGSFGKDLGSFLKVRYNKYDP